MVSFAGEDLLLDYVDRYSNWGRWGEQDQLGTLNFVGPEQVVAAVKAVRHGRTISCSLPFDQNGPQPGTLRPNPRNLMTATGTDHVSGAQDMLPAGFGPAKGFGRSDDILIIPNQSSTQWDSLSHVFWRGKMWNGNSAELVTSGGAKRCGIDVYAGKMLLRGVLLDVAAYKGVASLDPGYPITVEDLEETAAAHNVDIKTGDALLVRTGFLGARRGRWGDYAGGPSPGLSLHTVGFLHEHEIAAIVADTWGIEVRPNEIDLYQPFHIVALVHMGMALGEIFDLEALAVACRDLKQYEFLFAAPALPITGASGSPVGAIAVL